MSRLESLLKSDPVFCFGSDTDWAQDLPIESMLRTFSETGSALTVFATHDTPVLRHPGERMQVGVHPNFLPGTTHGDSVDGVIDHVFDLYPEAETFRSHSYFDSQFVTERMAARGIVYDANLCLYRQSRLAPLRHCHIAWRFPSWLDDNIHWRHDGSWRLEDMLDELQTPGLKIINVHPFVFALNLPSRASYEDVRSVFQSTDPEVIEEKRFGGHGPQTFLRDLLAWLDGRHPTYLLSELHELQTTEPAATVDPRLVTGAKHAEVDGRPPVEPDYAAASPTERMELVRKQYNEMDAGDRYATSRDYNNREIEIDAIKREMTGNRVLDIGCGNGYTLLMLGSFLSEGHLVGVDFSENMIDGARKLMADHFADALKVRPDYVCSDVMSYLETVEPGGFDTIISERLVINLPSWEYQKTVIAAILDRLPGGGRYLMVEGTELGFQEINRVRVASGLAAIPGAYPGNESSNKLDEDALDAFLAERGDVAVRSPSVFSFYSIASKVLHPLIVAPDEPKFASPINDKARLVQESLTACGLSLPDIGAAKLWVIEKL